MTDILERIEAERDARAIDPTRPANPILREAAEEIKRLRQEVVNLQRGAYFGALKAQQS